MSKSKPKSKSVSQELQNSLDVIIEKRGVKLKIKELSEELDLLAIEILELMQDYVSSTLEQEGLLKKGFLSIAKSRYVHGFGPLSSSIPSDETEGFEVALTKVKYTSSSSSGNSDTDTGSDNKRVLSTSTDLHPNMLKKMGLSNSGPIKNVSNSFQLILESCIARANTADLLAFKTNRYQQLLENKKQLEKKIEE